MIRFIFWSNEITGKLLFKGQQWVLLARTVIYTIYIYKAEKIPLDARRMEWVTLQTQFSLEQVSIESIKLSWPQNLFIVWTELNKSWSYWFSGLMEEIKRKWKDALKHQMRGFRGNVSALPFPSLEDVTSDQWKYAVSDLIKLWVSVLH